MPLSAIQPERYEELLADKILQVTNLLKPFSPPSPEIFKSQLTRFRMRAEFRVWHDGDGLDYVMFRRGDPKTPVPIDAFPIADESIQALMPALRERLIPSEALRRKLFQVEFLSTLSGEMLVTLIYHRKLEEPWEDAAKELREQLEALCPGISIIGRSRKQRIVLGRDYVNERLTVHGNSYTYRQYEQAFTQPNGRVNTHMLEWACSMASSLPKGDLLELYCGNGNFTLPLSGHFDDVIATELAKSSVRAARHNIEENGIGNISIIRLSAEEVTQAIQGVREFRRLKDIPKPLGDYDFRCVFVDPPRAGLDEHTTAMVASFESILYISCNPESLATNLQALTETHKISSFALFDQFPYTHHMECGVLLQRKIS
jgi:tRNA (uracil-5-)-methyltransferase